MKCCICGCEVEMDKSNNPMPICNINDFSSRCCGECNNFVVQARILSLSHKKTNVKHGDDLIIFHSVNSNEPTEFLVKNHKFICGMVETIKTENGVINYYGSWGNYPIREDDSFVVR